MTGGLPGTRPDSRPERAEVLLQDLRARYGLAETFLDCSEGRLTGGSALPGAQPGAFGYAQREGVIRLLSVANADSLMETIDHEDDIPFWAEIWDSALGLSRHIWQRYAAGMHGTPVLELGCGVGTAGLAAASRGAHVTQVDFAEAALEFAAHNAVANDLRASVCQLLADIRELSLGRRFGLIIGSDILYEPNLHRAILRVMDGHLLEGGCAIFADPGRRWASGFVTMATPLGWSYSLDVVDVSGRNGARAIDILTLSKEAAPRDDAVQSVPR